MAAETVGSLQGPDWATESANHLPSVPEEASNSSGGYVRSSRQSTLPPIAVP